MPLIEFKNVSFEYPNGYVAVKDLNFKIKEGSNIAIVGQNGAGKTTTVKMMNGLLKPTTGSVIVDGKDSKEYSAAILSRTTGYVFQNPDDQIFHSTVGKEIEFGPKVLGYNGEEIKDLSKEAAKLVNLQNELEENPYNLPLSIRKFVTIASVLAMDTKVIILDEPTAGQDRYGILILESLLKHLQARGKTIITITHDMEFVMNNFRTVYVMAEKKLLEIDKPEDIFSNEQLLETSMFKPPFISQMVNELHLNKNIITMDQLVEELVKAHN